MEKRRSGERRSEGRASRRGKWKEGIGASIIDWDTLLKMGKRRDKEREARAPSWDLGGSSGEYRGTYQNG